MKTDSIANNARYAVPQSHITLTKALSWMGRASINLPAAALGLALPRCRSSLPAHFRHGSPGSTCALNLTAIAA